MLEDADEILGELSCGEVQEMMDKMLGEQSFSFTGYVEKLMQGQIPFSADGLTYGLVNGLAAGVAQERKMFLYLILIAVIGAVLGNFTSLLQGKQVSLFSILL